jgi:hypothetical protein
LIPKQPPILLPAVERQVNRQKPQFSQCTITRWS